MKSLIDGYEERVERTEGKGWRNRGEQKRNFVYMFQLSCLTSIFTSKHLTSFINSGYWKLTFELIYFCNINDLVQYTSFLPMIPIGANRIISYICIAKTQ